MTRFLSQGTLNALARDVRRPLFDRSRIGTGIVHFGPGAFHRAHQAWFVERLLPRDPRWGICAVSLRGRDVRDALLPQDGLYTLVTLDTEVSYEVIGALKEVLVAPEDPQSVLARLTAAPTRIVTVTVTEKGYCLTAGGELDFNHPAIVRDLATPHAPASLVGYLVEALDRRRSGDLAPLTVISCDNLVDNGPRLSHAVMQLAHARDPGLARWIEDRVRFPATMVDSITPATTDALRQQTAAAIGMLDRWPVQRESFAQWVMEDWSGRDGPDWASAGVIVTDSVAAYERAKLRLLNGAHSTLAYLGLLSNYVTVSQAIHDADLAAFVGVLMREDICATLTAPKGMELGQYIDTILDRFRNPALHHALAQIAWDGSQKLPIRLLGTIADTIAARRPVDRLCLPVAAWMQFIRREAVAGRPVTDPLAARLLQIGGACRNRALEDVPLFLALHSVFPRELAADESFRSALSAAYDSLARCGSHPRVILDAR